MNICQKSIAKFTSKDTVMIKGIAIILMICNHLYPIPDWIYPENMYFSIPFAGKTIAAYWGGYSKICVAIFAFLTGIGFFYSIGKKSIKEAYITNLKKGIKFLLVYWLIIVLVYIPIMILSDLYVFDLADFLLNLFGYRTSYCWIAWYVRFYVEVLATFPLIIGVFKLGSWEKKPLCVRLIVLVVLWGLHVYIKNPTDGILHYVAEYLTYIPLIILGYIVAEKDLLSIFSNWIQKFNLVYRVGFALVLFGVSVLGRICIKQFFYFHLDFFYAPLFILAAIVIIKAFDNSKMNKFLIILGENSQALWFLHAIFFIRNPKIQYIAYWPKLSILILIWVILILLPLASVFNKLSNVISKRLFSF